MVNLEFVSFWFLYKYILLAIEYDSSYFKKKEKNGAHIAFKNTACYLDRATSFDQAP